MIADSAEEILSHMILTYHPRLALACSFQKEDSVLIDMALSLEPEIKIFTIDTGELFPETYRTWEKIEDHYDIVIEDYAAFGKWTKDNCCSNSKIAALDTALENVDGWITGLRREQAPTRTNTPKLDFDDQRNVWKAAPLADWTEEQVWEYINERGLPYNLLHNEGYDSIGCAPCTIAGAGREGRWVGSDKIECGIHSVI